MNARLRAGCHTVASGKGGCGLRTSFDLRGNDIGDGSMSIHAPSPAVLALVNWEYKTRSRTCSSVERLPTSWSGCISCSLYVHGKEIRGRRAQLAPPPRLHPDLRLTAPPRLPPCTKSARSPFGGRRTRSCFPGNNEGHEGMKGGGVSHGEVGTRDWALARESLERPLKARFRSPPVGPVLGIRKPPAPLWNGCSTKQIDLSAWVSTLQVTLPLLTGRSPLCQLCRSARLP
jgi:hypothetical protein